MGQKIQRNSVAGGMPPHRPPAAGTAENRSEKAAQWPRKNARKPASGAATLRASVFSPSIAQSVGTPGPARIAVELDPEVQFQVGDLAEVWAPNSPTGKDDE